jgi:parallel beta-helix repeat protein
LVTVANAHPSGTTFCLAAGTYNLTAPIPVGSGDKWVGALGAQGQRATILDGRDQIGHAFDNNSAVNGEIRNVIIEDFNNAFEDAPIEVDNGWLFDNIESRENFGYGIYLDAGATLRNSYIHHNHQLGVGGQGNNILVENNEISFNNYLREADPSWEAGGSKWLNTNNLIVRNNFVHHNCGYGLWTDFNNFGTLYEGNVVEDNHGSGIFHEISGNAIIRNNEVRRNALGQSGNPACNGTGGTSQGGIKIATSFSVEVFGNVLVDNDGGVYLNYEQRGSWHTSDNFIHDNHSTYSTGPTGCRDDTGTNWCFTHNNRFENNDYDIPSATSTSFLWQGGGKTWSQWQGFGQDLTGSIS